MRRPTSKALFGILLVSTIVLAGFPIRAAAETTVEKIMNDGDSYDGRKVSVKGTVSNLKFETLEVGKTYTTFLLVGKSGGRIKVSVSRTLKLKPGQEVKVNGVYRKVRKTTHRYYYNEIQASKVK
jgi:hypothetical protein